MYIQDENELAQLLRDAAQAHHAFEATLGHPDEDWPGWYAKHIAGKLREREARGQPAT